MQEGQYEYNIYFLQCNVKYLIHYIFLIYIHAFPTTLCNKNIDTPKYSYTKRLHFTDASINEM